MITKSDEANESKYVFYAKMDNAKVLYNLAKAVSFKDHAVFCVQEDGFKISCEDAKCTQGVAFVHCELFQEYSVKEDCVCVKINLAQLIECLNIFGSVNGGIPTALKIYYEGYGHPLVILLEDNGIITECSVKTMESEDLLNFEFDHDKVVNKLIMKSDCLKEILSEIDTSNDIIEIVISKEKEFMRLSSFGLIGDTHVDIPSTSDYMEVFDCSISQSFRYKVNFIKNCTKALASASKVALRFADSGVMSIQFLIPIPDMQKQAFVEFYFCPDQEVE
jgi:cell cycle checkpoint protein